MARPTIPAHIREQQINELPNIRFVRWDGPYRGAPSKAVCRCEVDGFEWSARVNDLCNKDSGCPSCAGQRRWTSEERISQINAIPNIAFVRWAGPYKNHKSKAVFRCEIDGLEWSTSIHSLLNTSRGCPSCAKSGYDRTKDGTLYFLRSECGTMVKIGVSNNYVQRHRTLKHRTPFGWACMELIHGSGSLIARLEKELHNKTETVQFAEKFDGHTEWRRWTERTQSLIASAVRRVDLANERLAKWLG